MIVFYTCLQISKLKYCNVSGYGYEVQLVSITTTCEDANWFVSHFESKRIRVTLARRT